MLWGFYGLVGSLLRIYLLDERTKSQDMQDHTRYFFNCTRLQKELKSEVKRLEKLIRLMSLRTMACNSSQRVVACPQAVYCTRHQPCQVKSDCVTKLSKCLCMYPIYKSPGCTCLTKNLATIEVYYSQRVGEVVVKCIFQQFFSYTRMID